MAVLTALGGVLQLLTQLPVVHSRLGGREAEPSARCGCRSPGTSCR